ncbi:hypothetical protein [Nocardia gamkensis]|uniref:Uncharacterized protein n=1 Tax=Nocardia gamkensis TaxID=352869 RepID=A0A7X6L4G6_9NOCA|nr:hypothetical protein [Nocardia gamkensis]NKY27560.1 hypothetical protein [Nocardia gamkensis]NQE71740.1 hypothetical protein [Nocardia gamkensis]
MEFDAAHFELIIKDIEKNLTVLSSKLDSVPHVVDNAIDHWWVTDGMEASIRWTGEKIIEFGKWLWDTIKDVLKGVAAPLFLGKCAFDWYGVRESATLVQSEINPDVLSVNREWQGAAQLAYARTMTSQREAVKRIGEIGKDASTSVLAVAVGGLVFYVAMGAILSKAIAEIAAAIAGLGSGVFSWAGAALLLEAITSTSISMAAALAALATLTGAQVTGLVALEATATDNGPFPGGRWPDPNTKTFDDGTRLDGTANWSVR